ncbi:MAG: phosphotransferase [Candidatus Obscuribacterales bacterium]|nr:phosphotransferase [Candidatus Obscuribacterales bacterium]
MVFVPEDPSLRLLTPAPEEKLNGWLKEFFGKPVRISHRETLRHRDLSKVERLSFEDCLPESLIYKQVLPPWDIEQDLHERILIPSVAGSAQLYMAAHHGPLTALLVQDLGTTCLKEHDVDSKTARQLGEELARMHRAYSYRTDELIQMNILRSLTPIDYEEFAAREIVEPMVGWSDMSAEDARAIGQLTHVIAHKLAGEPISLVHGDLFGENIVLHKQSLFLIDWSWFAIIGVPTTDLASLTSQHDKNGKLRKYAPEILEAYCFESGRKTEDVNAVLPYAAQLERLLFLYWLVVRKSMGILGTTIGPVENVMRIVLDDLILRERNERS